MASWLMFNVLTGRQVLNNSLSDVLQILSHCTYIMSCVELEGEVKTLTKNKSELQTSLDEWKVTEISRLFCVILELCFMDLASVCLLSAVYSAIVAFSIEVVLNEWWEVSICSYSDHKYMDGNWVIIQRHLKCFFSMKRQPESDQKSQESKWARN